jgi:hypothetical protein
MILKIYYRKLKRIIFNHKITLLKNQKQNLKLYKEGYLPMPGRLAWATVEMCDAVVVAAPERNRVEEPIGR